MRLYYKPGACSLSSRIVMAEIGMAHESTKVDTATGLTETGENYLAINPKGYVPALEVEPGIVITENPAILQYLADTNPNANLAPTPTTLERVRVQEWLNFTSSELHKAFSPLFSGRDLAGEERTRVDAHLAKCIALVEQHLADGRSFLVEDHFTIADAYLFVVLNWTNFVGVSLTDWPHVAAYVVRISARPSVRQAMQAEGLIAAEAIA